jgi:hypothetical protein
MNAHRSLFGRGRKPSLGQPVRWPATSGKDFVTCGGERGSGVQLGVPRRGWPACSTTIRRLLVVGESLKH